MLARGEGVWCGRCELRRWTCGKAVCDDRGSNGCDL